MKTLVFDFGGIISLPKGLYYITLYPDSDEWHAAERGDIPEEEFWKKLEKFYQKSTEEIIQMIFEEKQPNTELLEFIGKNKTKVKTALITNCLSKIAQYFIDKWDLRNFFDTILISSKEKLAKPNPNLFLKVTEKLGVKPEDCFYVAKKESYAEIALSLGMRATVFHSNEQTKTELTKFISS